MTGDTKLFQEALKRGSAHAWNEQWGKAAEEYRRALREFPEDISARTYLAMALYKSGGHREALELYQSLWSAQPSNLTMLQRVAELQEAVGDKQAASMSYGRLADAHTRRRAPREAFRAWHKVVELSPGNPVLWNSLIQMAIQAGTVKEIIPGYLGLARDLALQSRFQDAIQVAQRAQTLDPESPLVVPMLAAIRKGIEYSLRATSFGEEVFAEDLMRYLPSIEVLQSRLQQQAQAGVPDSSPVSETLAGNELFDRPGSPVVRAVSDGRNVVEIRLAPTPELVEQGLTANNVRDSLGKLGEVVRVSPEVGPGGGVVFVIVLSTSAGVPQVQQAVERLWLRPSQVLEVEAPVLPEPGRPVLPEPGRIEGEPAGQEALEEEQAEAEAHAETVVEAEVEPEPAATEPEIVEAVSVEPEIIDGPSVEPEIIDGPSVEPEVVDVASMPAEDDAPAVAVDESEGSQDAAGTDQADTQPAAGIEAELVEPEPELEPEPEIGPEPDPEVELEADLLMEPVSSFEIDRLAPPGAELETYQEDESWDASLDGPSAIQDPPAEKTAGEVVAAIALEAVGDAPEAPELESEDIPVLETPQAGILDEPVAVVAVPGESLEVDTLPDDSPEAENASDEPAPVQEITVAGPVTPDMEGLAIPEPSLDEIHGSGLLQEDGAEDQVAEAPGEAQEILDAPDETLEAPVEELSEISMEAQGGHPEAAPAATGPEAELVAEEPEQIETAWSLDDYAEPDAIAADEPAISETVPVEPEATIQEPARTQEMIIAEAEAARHSGDLAEAVRLYEQAIGMGNPTALQYSALGELYEEWGRRELAVLAFGQALSETPDLPEALLGLARGDLFDHRLDQAESRVRHALGKPLPEHRNLEASAAGLLLDILHERAAYGDLGAAAEGLSWLRSSATKNRMPPHLLQRIAETPRELLGHVAAEHLDEVSALHRHARGDVVSTLRKTEELLGDGSVRSAADETYRLVSSYPEFLPAQSLLGRVLVAQGRRKEAAEHSRRVVEVYSLRGKEEDALEILEWMSEAGLGTEADQQRLVSLLSLRGRREDAEVLAERLAAAEREAADRAAAEERARLAAEEEAARLIAEESARRAAEAARRRAVAEELVRKAIDELSGRAGEQASALGSHVPYLAASAQELLGDAESHGKGKDESQPRRGIFGMFRSLRGGGKKDAIAETAAGRPDSDAGASPDVRARDALLSAAESRFAAGDPKGAAGLLLSALKDEQVSSDLSTRVSLLRILRVARPQDEELREALAEIVAIMGLPEDLAN